MYRRAVQRIPPELTTYARRMRREPTDAERRLWQNLRLLRPRFTRQLVVSHYILDFACSSLRVAIELDGGQHAVDVSADHVRTLYLEDCGWSVLRFWNHDVLDNMEGVLSAIRQALSTAATHPNPSLPGRGLNDRTGR